MKRTKLLTLSLLSASLALAAHAAVTPLRPNNLATHVFQAQGRPLTLPSQAAPTAIVASYLRGKGQSDATVRSLRLKSESPAWRSSQHHLRMTQEVGGMAVYDSYVKATVNHRGQLVSVIANIAPVPASGVARASIDERAALAAAFRALKIPAGMPQVVGRNGETTSFAKGSLFLENPMVTKVAIPMSDATMSTGYLVETWRSIGNRLHETLVDGNGRVVEVVSRTNTDSYNVFAIDPEKSTQATVAG
ncbi:MAG: hypothetical protein ABIO58_00340 [Luteimonas sp.]